jgi:hypothetical protein
MMDINFSAVREQIKATPARSAWRRGVAAYALELLDSVAGRAAYEGHGPEDVAQLRKWMLDGARDWSEYSYGGCSLVYDGDIAERLCTPSELRKTRGGERNPNCRESWLDVQARALYRAACVVVNACKEVQA